MNRRAAQAVRLQRTVEGLSVIAVSYYGLALLKVAFEGLYKAGLVQISPTIAAAVSLPVVVLGFWLLMRRLTHRVLKADDTG